MHYRPFCNNKNALFFQQLLIFGTQRATFFHRLQNKLPFKHILPQQPIARDHNMGLICNEKTSFPQKPRMTFPKAPVQQPVRRMGKATRQLRTLPWATPGQTGFCRRMPDPRALRRASPNQPGTNGAAFSRGIALGPSHQLTCYMLSPGLDGSVVTCVSVCQPQPFVKPPNSKIQTLHLKNITSGCICQGQVE